MSSPCCRCAQAGTSCCTNRQIHLTSGDMACISRFLGWNDFSTIEAPDPWYLEPEYDPAWLTWTLGPGGLLRVLKRKQGKACGMLTGTGCLLPFHERPMICRLHPFMYTEEGILGIDPTCPISRKADWPSVLEKLGMPIEKARDWQRMLYAELYSDKTRGHEPWGSEPLDEAGRAGIALPRQRSAVTHHAA